MELSGEISDRIFTYIDKNQDVFVENLRRVVEVPSISQQKEFRDQTIAIVETFKGILEAKGVACDLCNLGYETYSDGEKIPLPPVLIGKLGSDTKKKTLCIYGHLDVQPAELSDGWHTEPFKMVEKDGKLYGRGTTDDKGPVMAWLNMLDAFRETDISLPVNLRFIFEAMEESGSIGLHPLIYTLKDNFLKDVDYFCISDSYWLGQTRPCISYGLRGNVYFFIEVECAKKDLHSGSYGGAVHEAMTDLIHLMAKLTDDRGEILIPGIMDDVVPFSTQERILLESLDFDCDQFREEVGTEKLRHEDKVNVLASRWRFPCLTMHGIEGAFAGSGAKTVIPRRVVGKFSIRLVPNQDPDDVTQKVESYLRAEFGKLDSPNNLKVSRVKSSRPWLGDTNENNFIAAKLAIRNVYGVKPDMTREGGSIPVTLTFQEATGKSVVLLPLGAADDGAHSQNEKINRKNYIEGSKIMAAYCYFLSAL